MTIQHEPHAACSTCQANAGLKQKAAELRRFITRATPSLSVADASDEGARSIRTAAGEWLAATSDCLCREMAPHAACESCGILLGPGHLEQGENGYCRTCAFTNTCAKPAGYDATRNGDVGRRGWLPDYGPRAGLDKMGRERKLGP